MTTRFTRTSNITKTVVAASLITLASQAHAQFGGLFQNIVNSAVQQATQQATATAAQAAAGQVPVQAPLTAATASAGFTPDQMSAIGTAAAAISPRDPEYLAMLTQGLAAVPAEHKNLMAPVVDQQVRRQLATRRLGYTAVAPAIAANPALAGQADNALANAAVQAALSQGVGNNGGINPAALNTTAGQAVAAGAIIQGLGSLFGNRTAPAATAVQP